MQLQIKIIFTYYPWKMLSDTGSIKCPGPASPVTARSPAENESHGIPVAAPPEHLANYSTPANNSHPEGIRSTSPLCNY